MWDADITSAFRWRSRPAAGGAKAAGCGLRGFTTWYEGVAEKATRRESPLISVLHSDRRYTAYNTPEISNLRVNILT